MNLRVAATGVANCQRSSRVANCQRSSQLAIYNSTTGMVPTRYFKEMSDNYGN